MLSSELVFDIVYLVPVAKTILPITGFQEQHNTKIYPSNFPKTNRASHIHSRRFSFSINFFQNLSTPEKLYSSVTNVWISVGTAEEFRQLPLLKPVEWHSKCDSKHRNYHSTMPIDNTTAAVNGCVPNLEMSSTACMKCNVFLGCRIALRRALSTVIDKLL